MSNPKKPTDLGRNRTGVKMSPIDAKATAKGAVEGTPPSGGRDEIMALRTERSRTSEPLGSMPPPLSLKGVAKTALEGIKGHHPTVLLDKVGERLAYERTGVRFYDALLAKYDAAHIHAGGPTRAELEEIRMDELRHFGMLVRVIRDLGGDETAMTPGADVMGVASLGILQVLTDPHTTFTQCLGAILIAEAGDVAGWDLLAELADGLGHDTLAAELRQAHAQEERHALLVRGWLAAALQGQAGITPTPPQPTSPSSA